MLRSLLLSALCFALLHTPSFSQPQIQTREVVTGLWVPWELVWGPDDFLWITERPGMVSRVNPETGERRIILNIRHRVAETNEGGMLGMKLHPNMADTPQVFIVHTFWNENDVLVRLVRYDYDAALDSLVNETILVDSIPGGLFHDGSQIAISDDRKIYMTTGEGGIQPRAQSHLTLAGKTLRMNMDGSTPEDNPWAAAPWPLSLIWTTGHRNPQGLAFGPDGTLYSSEHGQDDNDELNIIRRGRNYGWPYANGYCSDTLGAWPGIDKQQFCLDSNVAEPIMAWTPTVAPASLVYYSHTAIPQWHNSLLLTTLGRLKPELPPDSYSLLQITLSNDGQSIVKDTAYFRLQYGRLRGICVSPDGRVFISTSNQDGRAATEHGFPRAGDDRIIEISAPVGSNVPMKQQHAEFTVIPMPTIGDARITFARKFGRGTVKLFGKAGRTLRSEEFSGGNEYHFHRGDLGPGTYFLRINDGRHSLECPIVVQ